MESVRVRLVFEDRHILSKSQRSEGLKRSWLLLKPDHHQSFSDLSSYLLHIFHLHKSCPNGLLLSMDGFVLPPFESICILKDKDIICVKKKGGTWSDILKVGDAANSAEEVEIVEKQPLHTGVPLLANEEFEKENGGYESEPKDDEEDQSEDTLPIENSSGANAVSRKRKATNKLSSKKKKHRKVVLDDVRNDVHAEQIESCHKDGDLPRKYLRKKEKLSDAKNKPQTESTPESSERRNNNVESTPSVKRSDQLQENGEAVEDASHVPEGTRKVPSRSARRKKNKRKWLRELAKLGKKEVVCHSKGLLHWKQEPAKAEKKVVISHSKGLLHWKQEPSKAEKKEVVSHSKGLLHWKQLPGKDKIEHEQPNQSSDVEEDVVPIVIRPGHIRFEPLGKDQAVQQSQVAVETFQWNGITSKKKGQKWGKEKLSCARRNDYKDLDKEYTEMLTVEKEIPLNDPIDFDNLPPAPSLLKVGDVIAYRLLELSSSWTPELSSFRVGRISLYDPESRRIMLMPVPKYPVANEKLDDDASAQQPDNTLYREDGSLEIDFSALIDVRTVKHSNSDPAKAVTENGEVNPWEKFSKALNAEQTHAPTPENGEVNPWDKLCEALNAKKAQLSEGNDCNKRSSGRSPLSYKALRSGALGPTMAILRSKNKI